MKNSFLLGDNSSNQLYNLYKKMKLFSFILRAISIMILITNYVIIGYHYIEGIKLNGILIFIILLGCLISYIVFQISEALRKIKIKLNNLLNNYKDMCIKYGELYNIDKTKLYSRNKDQQLKYAEKFFNENLKTK